MLAQGFLFKQVCNIAFMLLVFAPIVRALLPRPPSAASFYTEFEVSAPANSTLIEDILRFVEQLCEAMPVLSCAPTHNVTVTPTHT